MKLGSVMSKIPSGRRVILRDYLTEELYGSTAVMNYLNSDFYYKYFKDLDVYGLDCRDEAIEILVVVEVQK